MQEHFRRGILPPVCLARHTSQAPALVLAALVLAALVLAAVLAEAVLAAAVLSVVCSAMIRSMASQSISSPSESMSAEHAVPLAAKCNAARRHSRLLPIRGGEKGNHKFLARCARVYGT